METNPQDRDPGADERLLALQRLLQSGTLSNSESIRRILKYVVEAAASGHAADIKEYTIATEALRFPEAFDCKADNRVRVQMQRLRKKLEEYYSGEGVQDSMRISIPVGHYTPHFETLLRQAPNGKESGTTARQTEVAQTALPGAARFPFFGRRAFLLSLLISIVALGISIFRRPAVRALPAGQKPKLPDSLACLWKPFVSTSQPPLIIYSNGLFLMSKQGDLYRYFASGAHFLPIGAKVPSLAGLNRSGPLPPGVGPLFYFDAYTGTGEVVAAADIAELLSGAGETFNIKRDGVVSYDDIRGSNVIFLGASLEDSVLRTLPIKTDLAFEEASQPEFVGSLEIRDLHPAPGAPSVYKLQRDQKTRALREESALISLLPGVMPGRYIMVLAGISTIGTQAAAEFATSEECMRTISRALAGAPGESGVPAYFQALLRVQIRDGAGAETSCLFVKRLAFPQQIAPGVPQNGLRSSNKRVSASLDNGRPASR